MYQPANLRLPLLALGLTLLLGTAACKKDKDTSPDENELVTNATDQATSENDDATAADFSAQDVPADMSRAINSSSPTADRQSASGGCATRTWVPNASGVGGTLTIDFGTTNCMCNDGRQRRGQLIAVVSGPLYVPGSTVKITRQNYFVNDNQHLGTRTDSITAPNEWDVRVRNAGVVFASGAGTSSWRADRHVKRTIDGNGFTTLTITGSAAGVNRKGRQYEAVIQTPLVKRRESGCADVFVDGTVFLNKITADKTALLNYNPAGTQPAPCDRTASVTVNGITRTINLR